MSEGLVGGEGFAINASIIKADTNWQRGVDASDDTDLCDPKVATRPVREYIAALDGQTIQSGTPATKISLTDLASRWTAAQGGPAFYAYSAYGSAPTLAWLVDDKAIEPHIPVWDKSAG